MSNIYLFSSRSEIRDEAREWVLKFNSDVEVTAEQIAQLQQWAARSPEHRLQLRQAETVWCDAEKLEALLTPRQPVSRRRSLARTSSAVAACVLATMLTLLLLNDPDFGSKDEAFVTAIGEQKTIDLSDGSVIYLDTNSAIDVELTDELRLIRLLRGKAYFDVAKDPSRPFDVYTSYGRIRAVGTAFSVFLDAANVTVVVEEGRVELARSEPQAPRPDESSAAVETQRTATKSKTFASLGVGEKAIFNARANSQEKLPMGDITRDLAWRRGVLIFAGEPLEKVIREIGRYTPTSIEIANPELSQLAIGGRFRTGELEALLDVLEVGFGVKVTHLDDNTIELR